MFGADRNACPGDFGRTGERLRSRTQVRTDQKARIAFTRAAKVGQHIMCSRERFEAPTSSAGSPRRMVMSR